MKDINLIRKIAWSFHHTTGLEWDDLFQEAALAYLNAKKKFIYTHNLKLTTFAYKEMNHALCNYIKKQITGHSHVICFSKLNDPPPIPLYESHELWQELEYNALKLAEIMVNNIQEISLMSPLQARKYLYKKAQKQGMDFDQILKGVVELHEHYSV